MPGDDGYRDCFKEHLDNFTTYDQYVDVVSCWEEFFTNQYKQHFDHFYFDRFPTMHRITEGEPLPPDFAVYFNEEYGIVFEISRTMPRDDVPFDNELDQIRNYDSDLQFTTGDGKQALVKTQDIALVVSTTDAQTIEHRLAERIDSGTLDLSCNLIALEYTYLD